MYFETVLYLFVIILKGMNVKNKKDKKNLYLLNNSYIEIPRLFQEIYKITNIKIEISIKYKKTLLLFGERLIM